MSEQASIQPLAKRHGREAGRLHMEGIPTGFLSSLGLGFLTQLYKAIASCPGGFGYVWSEGGRTLGFVACAERVGRLYKEALKRRGPLMALPLARYMIRPAVLRRMWQTWRYPSQVGEALPPAEVLSIAVSPEARGRGVGRALMSAAVREFARRGIGAAKVAVWAGNEGANAFYPRCGFELALQREHHGLPMNVYVVRTGIHEDE